MRKAFMDPGIQFVWNTRVTALTRNEGVINGVTTEHERTGVKKRFRTYSVILATARDYNAKLWTQDADFEGLENVKYRQRRA